MEYQGVTFPTVEHAYQAAKSDDPKVWEEFSKLYSPGKSKNLGKRLTIREDWDKIKVEISDNQLEDYNEY